MTLRDLLLNDGSYRMMKCSLFALMVVIYALAGIAMFLLLERV